MIYTDELLWALIVFVGVAWFALRYLVVFKANWITIVLVAVIGLFALPYLPQVMTRDLAVGALMAFAVVYAVKTIFKTQDWVKSAALVLALYVGASLLLGFQVA
ncbi:MAG: hypothetical protein ACP5O3_04335 [Candidatus Micrarchaeia archaeon]|jgi:lipid-A-disaccharide synthase-like uncharacterized protein